jgi:hypothetical protein
MTKPSGGTSPIHRFTALASCSLFLLFLSFSQPHRVHHFFEGLGHLHDETRVDSEHHDHDQSRTKPAQNDCAVQSVAQNCHLGQAELVALPFVESHLESFRPQTSQWIDLFTAFPFFQRAPPKDTLLS